MQFLYIHNFSKSRSSLIPELSKRCCQVIQSYRAGVDTGGAGVLHVKIIWIERVSRWLSTAITIGDLGHADQYRVSPDICAGDQLTIIMYAGIEILATAAMLNRRLYRPFRQENNIATVEPPNNGQVGTWPFKLWRLSFIGEFLFSF